MEGMREYWRRAYQMARIARRQEEDDTIQAYAWKSLCQAAFDTLPISVPFSTRLAVATLAEMAAYMPSRGKQGRPTFYRSTRLAMALSKWASSKKG